MPGALPIFCVNQGGPSPCRPLPRSNVENLGNSSGGAKKMGLGELNQGCRLHWGSLSSPADDESPLPFGRR